MRRDCPLPKSPCSCRCDFTFRCCRGCKQRSGPTFQRKCVRCASATALPFVCAAWPRHLRIRSRDLVHGYALQALLLRTHRGTAAGACFVDLRMALSSEVTDIPRRSPSAVVSSPAPPVWRILTISLHVAASIVLCPYQKQQCPPLNFAQYKSLGCLVSLSSGLVYKN